MSAHKPRLVISRRAQRDLQNIMVYIEQQWGHSQRHAYSRLFSEAFAVLVDFPEMGPARPDLRKGFRTYRVGQHVVIFEPSKTVLRIIRVVHARSDLNAQLEC